MDNEKIAGTIKKEKRVEPRNSEETSKDKVETKEDKGRTEAAKPVDPNKNVDFEHVDIMLEDKRESSSEVSEGGGGDEQELEEQEITEEESMEYLKKEMETLRKETMIITVRISRMIREKAEPEVIEAERSALEETKENLERLKDTLRLIHEVGNLEVNVKPVDKDTGSFKGIPKLPKFRQGSGLDDAEEFLEKFESIMEAAEIAERRYKALLKTCLDPVDYNWAKKHEGANWKGFKEKFVEHFKAPNANMLWIKELQEMKVSRDLSVQKYTDKFRSIIKKLKMSDKEEMAVYYYRQGLPTWMEIGITPSIAMIRRTKEGKVSIDDIEAIALELEANRKETTVTKKKSCGYCSRIGHVESECFLKKMNTGSGKRMEESSRPRMTERKRDEPRNVVSKAPEARKEPKKDDTKRDTEMEQKKCYYCGEMGHIKKDCPVLNKKDRAIKYVAVEKDTQGNKDTSKYDSVEAVKVIGSLSGETVGRRLECPCLINSVKAIAQIDTGAEVSAVHIDLVREHG